MAAALVASGADLLVVGGAARALIDGDHVPADLDIVTSRDARSIRLLAAALDRIGVQPAPPPNALTDCRPLRIVTSYGPLDVFTRDDLDAQPSRDLTIAGVRVRVAIADRRRVG